MNGFRTLLALTSLFALTAHAENAPTQKNLRMIEAAPELVELFADEFSTIVQRLDEKTFLVESDDIAKLSARAHQATGHCGGFMDVTDESSSMRINALGWDDDDSYQGRLPSLDKRDPEIKAALQEIRGENVKRYVTIYSGNFKTRAAKSTEGVKAPVWLRDQWQRMADEAGRKDIQVDLVSPPNGYDQQSVRITIPGKAEKFMDDSPIVIVGAHLDSINWNDGDEAPGVDDDASGIGALTEVYRVLLQRNVRPKFTIQFFGYAAEELGLLGSRSIAEKYKSKDIKIKGVMQLDMVAYPGDANSVTFMTDYTNKDLTLWSQELYGLYVGGDVKEDRCGYGCSDHASWHRYGYPTVMPFEAPMRQMNRRIHSTRDTWGEFLSQSHAEKFSKLAYAFVAELAK